MRKITKIVYGIVLLLSLSAPIFAQNNTFEFRDSLNRSILDLVDNEKWIEAENKFNSIELLCIQEKDSANLAFAYHNRGILNYFRSEYEEADRYFNLAYTIRKKLNDTLGQAHSINNIGIVALDVGDYTKAVESYYAALDVHEKLNNPAGISTALTNIGNVYFYEGEFNKALTYYLQSAQIDSSLKDTFALAEDYQNIALIVSSLSKASQRKSAFDSAMFFYNKSIEYYNSVSDENQYEIADVYVEQGGLCEDFGQLELANTLFNKSLIMHREIGNNIGIAEAYLNLGNLAIKAKKFKLAEEQYKKATAISDSIGRMDLLKECYNSLSEIYYSQGNKDKAYLQLQRYISIKDSLLNIKKSTLLAEMEARYNSEKQQLEIEKLEQEHTAQQAETARQNTFKIAFATGSLLLLILVIVIFRSLKKQEKAKAIIQQQKNEVTIQKQLIDEKNQEILDSIHYANGIQQALLNAEDKIDENFPNNFILFKPKDIVSGDFYWVRKEENHFYIAVADCTGHGVPGAFMSMLGIAFLNDTVSDLGGINPAEILNITRQRIIKELSQGEFGGNSKDGMDISLIKVPTNYTDEFEIEWAGANNPLWLIRNSDGVTESDKADVKWLEENGHTLLEFKPDKQPIAHYSKMSPFTCNKIKIKRGDNIYLFSDGFADQFGGKNGKKLMYKNFKKHLLNMAKKPMEGQKTELDSIFNSWKGDLEQIDDVCVLGLGIT